MPNNKEMTNKKPRLSLIPAEVLGDVAKVFEYGAATHGLNNWRSKGKVTTYLDAALRHTLQVVAFDEDDNDKESGLHHLDHAIADLMIARVYLIYKGKYNDDRFTIEQGKPL